MCQPLYQNLACLQYPKCWRLLSKQLLSSHLCLSVTLIDVWYLEPTIMMTRTISGALHSEIMNRVGTRTPISSCAVAVFTFYQNSSSDFSNDLQTWSDFKILNLRSKCGRVGHNSIYDYWEAIWLLSTKFEIAHVGWACNLLLDTALTNYCRFVSEGWEKPPNCIILHLFNTLTHVCWARCPPHANLQIKMRI